MTEDQKNLILDLALGKMSEKEFLDRYPIKFRNDSTYTSLILNDARNRRDAAQLECVLILFFRFGGEKKYSAALCQLLEENWHMQHENIVLLLKNLKDPSTVDCLYRAALANLAYLDYDGTRALAVKAISALGAIATEEAKEKLGLLTRSDNSSVSDSARRQLARGET